MKKQVSLFGNLPELSDKMRDINKDIVEKANNPQRSRTIVARGGGGANQALQNRVMAATETARQALVDDGTLQLVTSEQDLKEYIDAVIKYGRAALDTETTGLDVIDDKIVGMSLYVPGQKPMYVPIWHTDFKEKPVQENISHEVVKNEIQRCIDSGVEFIFHNAKFDMRVVRNQLGMDAYLYCGWDTQVAGNLLNENEPHNLDVLWDKYINKGQDRGNSYSLFDRLPFNYIPVDVAYLYAAFDAQMTWELYEFQYQFIGETSEQKEERGLDRVSKVYYDIELPIIKYLCEMEDTGVTIDKEVADELSERYSKKMQEAENAVQASIEKIDLTKLQLEQRAKLTKPINANSPQQLAIVIYDALKLKSPDRRNQRGTGEAVLVALKDKHPEHEVLFESILNYRGLRRLLSTYIKNIPKQVKEDSTGRLHGSLNQYGARTGRMSGSNPNLQNIPSRNREIRQMFIPAEGHIMIAADFSQQEPRILAHLCMELFDDSKLMDAYLAEKDLYTWMASVVYDMPYDECKEYDDEGNFMSEGFERRESVKSIILGSMYGRGVDSIAEQLGWSQNRAQQIHDLFFESFPGIKQVVDYYQEMARTEGYVETVYGRKRRLPEVSLPEFEFARMEDNSPVTDQSIISYYTGRLANTWGGQRNGIIRDAQSKGIRVIQNGGKIADGKRQSLNSVVQGGAADVTKLSIKLIGDNEELRELGYKMLFPVHDEIIGEAPAENALKCGKIVERLMVESCADVIKVPMKVEAQYIWRWFGEEIDEKDLQTT